MKGISLQYTEDDRVFFSDVAGIGDAKVRRQMFAVNPLHLGLAGPGRCCASVLCCTAEVALTSAGPDFGLHATRSM